MKKTLAALILLAAPALAQNPSTYREDSAHTSTQYGTFVLGVRKDVSGSFVDADGDYAPLQLDANGMFRAIVAQSGTWTVTANQGTAAAHANRWPVGLSDGSGFISPATDRTTAAAPFSLRLSDGSAFYVGAQTGQLPAALDGSGFLKVHEQGTHPVTVTSGSITASDPTFTDATGTTVPANAAFVAGTDGTNTRALKTDSSGELQVDVLTMPTVTVTDGSGALNVIVDSSALPSGASTLAEQQTQTTALQLIDNLPVTQGSTTSGQSGVLAQGAVTTAAPSYTTAQTSPLSLTTGGALRVDASAATVTVSGTVTTTPPSNASTNVAQFGGTNISTGTGTGGAGIPRVTLSSDSSLAANQSTNLAQVAGATTQTGNGTASGALRVSVASDSTGQIKVTDGSDTAQITTTAGGSLQVECTSGCGGSGGTSAADGAAFVASTTSGTPVMGARDDSSPGTVAEDKVGIARLTTNRALHVNLRDASGNELSVGGGTQYDEDTASGAADKITMAGAVRKDTAATLVDTDGDRTELQTDATGRLRVTGADTTQPVSGTFWQATQPVSGTVTANAGTNLNTSALALESGGNLATLAGAIDATGTTVPSSAHFIAGTDGTNTRAIKTDSSGELQVDVLTMPTTTVTGSITASDPTFTDATGTTVPTNAAFVAGTDGTNTRALKTDASGELQVDVLTVPTVTVTDGSGAMTVDGSVTANAGTNLNTSALALESGGNLATVAALSKAEDAAHSTGHTGVMGLAVRQATATDLSAGGTDGDYEPLQVDATGRLHVQTGTVTVTGTVTTTPPSNASTNVAQLAGTTTDTNSGSKSAGTLRVVIATDQPALTNKLLVTPDALPANQSVNLAQVAGATTQTGNGTASGAQRVTIASDSTGTTVATQGTAANLNVRADTSGATGAAPPARADYAGGIGSGATGGLMIGIPVCDSFVPINISTATTTLIVTGVSGRHVYICGLSLVTAAANNVALIAGTGATCGTSTAGMNGGTTAASGYNFAANGGIAQGGGLGAINRTETTGDSVCIVTSAGTQLSGALSYVIF